MSNQNGSPQNVQIHVETGSAEAHGWQVLGTLLACGAAVSLLYAIAQAGWLELAATGVSMLLVTMARLMWHAGMVAIPKRAVAEDDFKVTRGTMQQIYAEFQQWQARSGVLKIFALALAYTAAFLILRQGVSVALQVFTNIWVAGAAGAAAASVIVAPTMVPKILRAMKSTGVRVGPGAADGASKAE